MNEREARQLSIELMEIAEAACLTTIDGHGFPRTRAMFNLRRREQFPGLSGVFEEHQDDFLVYFTTNTSSSKIAQITKNPRVSVYYCKPADWRGLMLGGEIEVIADRDIKKALWQEGWKMYYPEGVDDTDYAVLGLFPKFANYYHQLDSFKLNL